MAKYASVTCHVKDCPYCANDRILRIQEKEDEWVMDDDGTDVLNAFHTMGTITVVLILAAVLGGMMYFGVIREFVR